MTMGKVTAKDNADFVISMIDRDLTTMIRKDSLDYLSLILTHLNSLTDELSKDIAETLSKIGENRPELFDSDISMGLPPEGAIRSLLDVLRLKNIDRLRDSDGIMTINEFIRTQKCLRDAEVSDWLEKNGLPLVGPNDELFDHIHTLNDTYCLILDDSEQRVTWFRKDGSFEYGDVVDTLIKVFSQYLEDSSNG